MSIESRRAAIASVENITSGYGSELAKSKGSAVGLVRREIEELAAQAAESEFLRELLLAKSRELAIEQSAVAALETRPRHGTPLIEHLNSLFDTLTDGIHIKPGERSVITLTFENTGYGWIMVGNGEPEVPTIPKVRSAKK